MAQIFSLAQRTTSFSITSACAEMRTASTTRAAVYEQGFTTFTATAQTIGIGRPAAQGTTPVNVLGLGEDNQDTAVTNISLSWATSPTAPANFFRRASMPGTAGAGFIWAYPRGLIAPVSASLVFWSITASVAADIYSVWQE